MSTSVESVRLEYQSGRAVPVASPRVSWITRSDLPNWRQSAAELAWNTGSGPVSAVLDGDASVLVNWPFDPLEPRAGGTLRVRVEGPDGWSDWSAEQAVFASFLGPTEWSADFIGLAAPARHAQPVLLRHEFPVAEGLVRATLYATAQ